MPSGLYVSWTDAELARLGELTRGGDRAHLCTAKINQEFHGGQAVRSVSGIRQKRMAHGFIEIRKNATAPRTDENNADRQQEITQKEADGVLEVRANGRKIKTVEDLLKHIEADMSRFEIAMSEASKYEGIARDLDGTVRVHEMFRVFVRLKAKAGPTVAEAVESLLTAAFKERKGPAVKLVPKTRGEMWQVVVIADPHFGKYAWKGSTGGPDYDLDIASHCVRTATDELLTLGDETYHPCRRTLAFLGDVFHYDNPQGTTTAGTPLERDGRYQKMIEVGADTCIAAIERSAMTCPTDVVVVGGNHDEILSAAFQRILVERFRRDARVTIDSRHTTRKYFRFGDTLLGVTHGDKAKKKLPQLMALEASKDWGETRYREIHTGHLHHQAAEWQRPIETIDGVVVRIAPSLSGADDWHAEHGFLGAPRGMETFFYRKSGGLAGMLVSSPDFPAPKTARIAA